MAGVYYKLRRNVALRGWEKLPWAIVHRPDNGVRFLKEEEFRALERCNGSQDCSCGQVSARTRALIGQMEKEGIVERCAYGDGMEQDQCYRMYKNRFIYAVHWSAGGRCDYQCKHCYLSAPDEAFGQLSHGQILDIIDQMDNYGILSVSIAGGELLTRGDWWDIADALREKQIDISSIHTNGELVTEELLDGLEARGMRPQFCIGYHGDQGWHDWLCGVPGAGGRVLDAFALCHRRRFRTEAEMLLHRGNAGVLRQSVNTLAAHGCEGLKVSNVTDDERAERQVGGYALPLEQAYAFYEQYIPLYFEDGSPLRLNLDGIFLCGKGSRDFLIPVKKRYDSEDSCLHQPMCSRMLNLNVGDVRRENQDLAACLLFMGGWEERIRAAAAASV